jgi:Uma2 family endonuclease
MSAAASIPLGEHVPTADGRVVMHRVPWSHYETQLALRGDVSSPRISYLDGTIEFMSPSKHDERIKSYIGCLLEAFALERGLDLSPYGSWTLKEAPKRAGVEPDECYLVGNDQSRETPDLAIEVVWTSGGIDKLEAYRRLRVPEVWFWKDGELHVHVLLDEAYAEVERSRVFPELDLRFVATFLDHPTATQAVRAFRAAITTTR